MTTTPFAPAAMAVAQVQAPAVVPAVAPAVASLLPGAEPLPGSPEALLLLAGMGVAPLTVANGIPQTASEGPFSPVVLMATGQRLLEVKAQLELLQQEQKELHEQLRLAHLRGDLRLLWAAGKDGASYQLQPHALLTRRPGRKQWLYSPSCQELECQLKARQQYEQSIGSAQCSLGASFWELRLSKS
jgi:hypothetical protein